MADWDTIRRYAATGSTQAFFDANPGISTQDLRDAQAAFPQVTVFGRALAARSGQASASGAPTTQTQTGQPSVQRGAATGPLRTAPPSGAYTPSPIGPEPDRLPPPDEGAGPARTLFTHLRALDNRAAVIPTPGDLGPWVLALTFLLFAVVSFNGYTRIQLVWYALTGAARVPGGIFGQQTVGSGGSGNGVGGLGGSIAQGNGSGAPPPPKQEAPGGFTPRAVGGGV